MRWNARIDHLLEELEQQADGLALAERDAEVAEQTRAEYASVDLAARLHGSLGCRLRAEVRTVGRVEGTLCRVGAGWYLLDGGTQAWVVPLPATSSLRGLSDHGVPARALSVTARLGLASALRGVAQDRDEVALHLLDGSVHRGTLARVGADFVELREGEPDSYVLTVPLEALAAVQSC